RANSPTFSLAVRETVEASPPAKKLAALIKATRKKLPKDPADLCTWLTKQPVPTVQSVLAVALATTIALGQGNGPEAEQSEGEVAKEAAGEIARVIKRDGAEHWAVTGENYLARVPRKFLMEQLGDTLKPNTRQQVEKMKRDQAAKAIMTELRGKRWLPPVMRN